MLGLGLKLGLGGTGFSPLDIPDLLLWLDASDTYTITTGATFTWADKSENGNNATQSTAASQPTSGVNTLNGRNTIDFASDYLDLTSTVNYRCVVIVMRNATGGVSSLYGGDTPADGEYTFINTNQTDPAYDISVDGSTGKTGTAYFNGGVGASGTNIDLGNTNAENEGSAIWMVNYDQLNRADYIAAFGTGATTTLTGSIAEVFMFGRNLETSELNELGNYLKNKWAQPFVNI